MKKEIKSLLKKTVKVAGVTCVAAGAVAVMTSGVAIKAITEGGKFLADAVKRIVDDNVVDAEVVKEDCVAHAEDFAPAESQQVAE